MLRVITKKGPQELFRESPSSHEAIKLAGKLFSTKIVHKNVMDSTSLVDFVITHNKSGRLHKEFNRVDDNRVSKTRLIVPHNNAEVVEKLQHGGEKVIRNST